MLWQVLDQDVNAMTEELINVWCGYDAKKTSRGIVLLELLYGISFENSFVLVF